MRTIQKASGKPTMPTLTCQAAPLSLQGFPILKNRTATGEYESERLLDMSIKIVYLPSDIANTY
jgi:hypothetical protein